MDLKFCICFFNIKLDSFRRYMVLEKLFVKSESISLKIGTNLLRILFLK